MLWGNLQAAVPRAECSPALSSAVCSEGQRDTSAPAEAALGHGGLPSCRVSASREAHSMAVMSGRSRGVSCWTGVTGVTPWEQKPHCAGTTLAEPLPVPWAHHNAWGQGVQAAPGRGGGTLVTPKVGKAERAILGPSGCWSICSRVAGLSCPRSC